MYHGTWERGRPARPIDKVIEMLMTRQSQLNAGVIARFGSRREPRRVPRLEEDWGEDASADTFSRGQLNGCYFLIISMLIISTIKLFVIKRHFPAKTCLFIRIHTDLYALALKHYLIDSEFDLPDLTLASTTKPPIPYAGMRGF